MLMIAPLRLTSGTSVRGAALLFAFDPENTPTITVDMVRRLFNLSEAESALAVALCSGKTVDEAAAERGISIHTARSQLKSIFGKTGTKRQADLVSLLLASPAYFLAQRSLA
jgi:DNA-binding CsgD family transcriptional regulator